MTFLLQNKTLLEAFRRGDRSALLSVYRHYVDLVTYVLSQGFFLQDGRKMKGANPEERIDLVQEVFMRAFAESARIAYDGVRPYQPYLLTITRRVLMNYYIKTYKHVFVDDFENAFDTLMRTTPVWPLDEGDDKELWLMQHAKTYIESLQEPLASYHRWRYVEGENQMNAARLMQLTRQQVRTLEQQLQQGLRKFLADKQSTKTNSQP